MRLIDADALKEKAIPLLFPTTVEPCGHIPVPVQAVVVAEIEQAPTIEVEPVRHGRWKQQRNEKTCSECAFIYYSNNDLWNYCPNCGAKMGEK